MRGNGAADLYELFWENSKLNPVNVRLFRARLDAYLATEKTAAGLQYPRADFRLPRANDRLARLMDGRRSERSFSDRRVDARTLGRLFAAFARTSRGSRTFASAGAIYPVELFCLVNRAAGDLERKAVYYNADNHSLSVVGDLPPWGEYADSINLKPDAGEPALVFVFVLLPERMTAKYGERGGRFQLIEVGHAAQNLALRLVAERMAGYEVGALLDEQVKRLLRLDGTTAHIALGYACGHMSGRRRLGRFAAGGRFIRP